MTLRTSLARALMAVRGFGPEVEREFRRALALSSPTDTAARRVPVLRALASYYMNIAELAKSAALGREILDLARQEHDTGSMVEGHVVIGSTVSFIGSLPEGLDHLERAIELFDPATHGSGRFRLGANAGVVARMASGLLLRPGGWPARAAGRVDEALELARSLDHPFSLAYALYHHGYFDAVSGRFESATACAAELERVAVQHDYPVWKALAPVVGGVASCGLGRAEEGLASVEAGLGFYQSLTTPPVFWPLLLALCGLAYLLGGRPERALELAGEAVRQAGPDEAAYPEFRILHGDAIAALTPADPAAAEASYRSARRGAHKTSFRLTELAATTRLVELLQSSGGGRAEREDLSTLYGTFTEGLDEPELAAARGVLGNDGTG